jgi:hypothetical protein
MVKLDINKKQMKFISIDIDFEEKILSILDTHKQKQIDLKKIENCCTAL